ILNRNERVTIEVKIFGGSGQLAFMDIDEGISFKAEQQFVDAAQNGFSPTSILVDAFPFVPYESGESRFWFRPNNQGSPVVTPPIGPDGAITLNFSIAYWKNGT